MENFDTLKHQTGGAPRYRLSNANVFVSPGGFHYIDYLDAVDEISPEIDETVLDDGEIAYIEEQLQSNEARFDNQVAAVKTFVDIKGKWVLDIGCGGGLFLSKMRDEGAVVTGVELSDSRAHYALTRHELCYGHDGCRDQF